MSTDPRRRLQLGALVLAQGGPGVWHDAGPYRIRTLATDADFGNAQPIDTEVPSDVEDGAMVETVGHDNRAQHFLVQVIGPTAEALAQGEAGLMAELERPNELAWTPPAGFGETTVFEVKVSHLEWSFDDFMEVPDGDRLPCRTFGIRLVSAPFGRSVEEVFVPGVGSGTGESTVPPTVTTVYSGVGTAGWSSTLGIQAAGGGGVTTVTHGTVSEESMTYSTSFPTAGTPWLRIQGAVKEIRYTVAGTTRPITATIVDGDSAYFYLPVTGTVTQLVVLGYDYQSVVVRSIARQDTAAVVATARQTSSTITVPGTARTQARFVVEHATVALGSTLLYSRPDDRSGYQPPLRRHRSTALSTTTETGNATSYSSLVSTLAPGQVEVYDIPISHLPAGGHGIWAQLQPPASGPVTLTVSAATVLGGVEHGTSQITRTITTLPVGVLSIVPLGDLTLPTVRVAPGAAAVCRIRVTASASCSIGEAWTFHESGALSWLECGTDTPSSGGSSNRLRIDSPTIAQPHRAAWVAHAADWSDARHADQLTQVRALDRHQWKPGPVQVFCATAAPNAKVGAGMYAHWMHNAARVDVPTGV